MIAMGVLVLAALPATRAFYLPGVAPQQYENFESVDMKVNKLTSIKTQLPYEYYALPFCQPTSARCGLWIVCCGITAAGRQWIPALPRAPPHRRICMNVFVF